MGAVVAELELDEGVLPPPVLVPILLRMLSHLLFGKLRWFCVWSSCPKTLAVVLTMESAVPVLSVESYHSRGEWVSGG